MIQRVQSVWLLLSTLVYITLFFMPVLTRQEGDITYYFYTMGVSKTSNGVAADHLPVSIGIVVVQVLLILASFLNIFKFKNRKLQKRICLATICVSALLMAWCAVEGQNFPGGLEGASYGPGAFAPALAILFNILAISGINKDERLIRSADRLR